VKGMVVNLGLAWFRDDTSSPHEDCAMSYELVYDIAWVVEVVMTSKTLTKEPHWQ